jgi:2-keto-4-pentenoate hydratase
MTPVSYTQSRNTAQGTRTALTEPHAAAEAFVRARRAGQALPVYPGTPPADLTQAYGIQDRAILLDGRRIDGWKVGRINPPDDARFGSNRLSGPIFAGSLVDASDGHEPEMPVFIGGFAAGEAEFLLHVAPSFSGALPVTDDETRALIDEVRIGIEIASSPYPGINADGAAVTVSDFGNNFGLVCGAPLVDWRDLDLRSVLVRTEIDGVLAGEATAATMLDGPYGAVRFLLANLASRGIDATRGFWVSTGAITGVHDVRPGQRLVAIFGDLGRTGCRIIAAGAGQADR